MKKIEEYNNYFISRDGLVYRQVKEGLKALKSWHGSPSNGGRYEYVGLSKDGSVKKIAVHRLVAKAFVENPNNHPEVNHINHDDKDNRAENLEWCSRKENMQHCFQKHSQVRNFKKCGLYYKGKLVYEADSVIDAARYANKKCGASVSGLQKYKKSIKHNCEIILP